jgi:hypothetical protein
MQMSIQLHFIEERLHTVLSENRLSLRPMHEPLMSSQLHFVPILLPALVSHDWALIVTDVYVPSAAVVAVENFTALLALVEILFFRFHHSAIREF